MASGRERKSATGIRTVSVRSPSALRELRAVGIAVVQIVFWTSFVVSIGMDRQPERGSKAEIQFDAVDFATLDDDEQRLYRRSLEGLLEAEDVRTQTGNWPSVEELAARRIPPFAPDPIDRFGYQWFVVRDKTLINYVGIPTDVARPTYVILALEPGPGETDPFAVVDETHHKLGTGLMIHVAVWRGTQRTRPAGPLATFAYQDGWRRVTNGTR